MQNSIVLNGKIYDAVTGAVIHEPAQMPEAHKPKVKKKTGLVMDGVMHHPANSHSKKARKSAVHHPKSAARHKLAKHHNAPSHHTPGHQAPNSHAPKTRQVAPAHRHKPQRPATLMRHAVKRPVHQQHQPPKPVHIHDARTAERLRRAQAVAKSHHIQRFPHHNNPSQRPVTKKVAHLAVKPAPAHHQPAAHAAPAPRPAPLSASEKLVSNALKNARAHEASHPYAKKPKKRLSHRMGFKRRTANLAMGSLAALLLVGFFVYQNVPNLSMRLASTRAGFNAQLPDYKPSGFSQDKLVTYSPGKVTVNFRSNSDERQFKLTQQVSNWNSHALADNYLVKTDKQYQTYEANGKTVYVYDGDSATWVNGGIWYQIEGESSLTSDQLLKIANSI